MQYTYHINLDERGYFEADVRNAFDKTVFQISGYEIFEDGFMKNKTDVDGLAKYLKGIGILQQTDTLKDEIKTSREMSVLQAGGKFEMSYEQNPEYIALKKQYNDIVKRMPPKGSTTLESQAEHIRRKMKRIAVPDYNPFEQGGPLNIGKVLQAVTSYTPPFRVFKKTLINRQSPLGKTWGMRYHPDLSILSLFRNDRNYQAKLIDGFKEHCLKIIGNTTNLVFSINEETPALVFTIQSPTQ